MSPLLLPPVIEGKARILGSERLIRIQCCHFWLVTLLKLLHILSLRDGCFTSPEEVTENECLTKDSRPPATTSPRFRMHVHLRITSQRNASALLLPLQAPHVCLQRTQAAASSHPSKTMFPETPSLFPTKQQLRASFLLDKALGLLVREPF